MLIIVKKNMSLDKYRLFKHVKMIKVGIYYGHQVLKLFARIGVLIRDSEWTKKICHIVWDSSKVSTIPNKWNLC